MILSMQPLAIQMNVANYVMVADACLPFQGGSLALAASPAVLSLAKQNLEAEIWTFCVERNLSSHILPILERIRQYFRPVGDARFSLVIDPDSDEQYLRLSATVAGTVKEVADAYDLYTAAWINATPSHVVSAIRLSLTIA